MVRNHFDALRPMEVRTAALLHITHSLMEPDFYSVKVPEDQWTWFIFPWNLHEDLRTLLPKTLIESKAEDEVQKAFQEQFHIEVSHELVRGTLKDLEAEGKVRRKGRTWALVR
jgi:hypoxanthine phosphoribosyltransferase